MKAVRPRISQETYERIMLDSTGVNYGYNSFEEALSHKVMIGSVKEKELKQSANKAIKEAENWKSAALGAAAGCIILCLMVAL